MKKLVVNLCFLALAVMVSSSWLSISQYVRSGTTGDIIFIVLSLFFFAVLRLSSGAFRRFAFFISLLSICAGLLTLFWPAHIDWPDFVPNFFRIVQPGSETKLFLLSFFGLFVLTLIMPPVRRLLSAQRGR